MNFCKIRARNIAVTISRPAFSVFFSTPLSSAWVSQPSGCQADLSRTAFGNFSLLPRNDQRAVLPSFAAPVMSPTKAASHNSYNAPDFYTLDSDVTAVAHEADQQPRPNEAR